MEKISLNKDVHNLGDCSVKEFMRNMIKNNAQENAFYVCNIGDLVCQHEIWKDKLPRVEPYYAVECNDNVILLQILSALGIGFACASKYEIDKVLQLGLDPEKIIFDNPVKLFSHIAQARDTGVRMTTFDSKSELEKIKQFHPKAELLIHVNFDDLSILETKFGCDSKNDAKELLEAAHSLGLNVVGIRCSLRNSSKDPEVYESVTEISHRLFHLALTLGFDFRILDIGDIHPQGSDDNFEKVFEKINTCIQRYFPEPHIRIIAQPTRVYINTAFTLACNIHSVKDIYVAKPGNEYTERCRMYYINDGVFSSFSNKYIRNETYFPQPLNSNSEARIIPCCIYGQTCDGLDVVVDNFMLPEMEIDDWIVFENMGAYTISFANHFNGYPKPETFFVADESTKSMLICKIRTENTSSMKYRTEKKMLAKNSRINGYLSLKSLVIKCTEQLFSILYNLVIRFFEKL